MKTKPHVMKTFRLAVNAAERLAHLAAEQFGGNETAAVESAIVSATAPPSLEEETWEALRASARRRLRKALTEPELEVCLQVTRSWWVTGPDAALIHHDIADLDQGDFDAGDPLFGAGPATTAPVDLQALAAKLAAMPDIDRAVLTLACREWWDRPAETRGGLDAVLGGPLRGVRAN